MFDTKLIRHLEYAELEAKAQALGREGWRVMTGYYGSNAHYLILQRSTPKYSGTCIPMIPAPKETPRGKTHNKGRGSRSKKPAADSSAK